MKLRHLTTSLIATAANGNSFDTGNINSGSSAMFTLSKVGTYSITAASTRSCRARPP